MSRGVALETAGGPIDAVISVPGSKSIANRALVCAAQAPGTSRLSNVPSGDDTVAMVEGLRSLGSSVGVDGTRVAVDGGPWRGGATLDAGLAGTTSRFLIAAAATCVEPSVIDGGEALRQRPMDDLLSTLAGLGASVESVRDPGRLPVRVCRGALRGGTVRIAGDTSSQFVSALMMIAPGLTGGLTLELSTPLVSRPYVDMTARVMESFGIRDVVVGRDRVVVASGEYRPTDYAIEPDASSASYPLAAAAITGGRVTVRGLRSDSMQGDRRIVSILADMGCGVTFDERGATVVGSGELRGVDVDMSDVSDLVPTVAAVATFAQSPTRISGVGFIRRKESDRLAALVEGLTKLGCMARESDDGIIIEPGDLAARHGAVLATHHDHRLAMTWSLLALRIPDVHLDDPSVVAKSWPDWWEVRSSLLAGAGR